MTPIDYANQALATILDRYTPETLPPKGQFLYHQGVFLDGMYHVYQQTKDPALMTFIKEWIDAHLTEAGEIPAANPNQLDFLQPAIMLFPLWEQTHAPRYKQALDFVASSIKHMPTNADGGRWHKDVTPHQMWLDGLYMGGPFEAAYGATFDQPQYLDDVVKQAVLMATHTRDAVTGLWYHAYDETKESPWADPVTGCSGFFWGRSMGWVPIALLDEMQHLAPGDLRYQQLAKLTRQLLTALAKYQSADGRWYQVVDQGQRLDNWLETSCTCLYVAGMLRAIDAGILARTYLPQAERGYAAVVDHLSYEGPHLQVSRVCVGTGVGDYDFYVNRPTQANDLHGIGAFLLMCAAKAEHDQ